MRNEKEFSEGYNSYHNLGKPKPENPSKDWKDGYEYALLEDSDYYEAYYAE